MVKIINTVNEKIKISDKNINTIDTSDNKHPQVEIQKLDVSSENKYVPEELKLNTDNNYDYTVSISKLEASKDRLNSFFNNNTFADSLISYDLKIHTDSCYASQGCCQIGDVTQVSSYNTGYGNQIYYNNDGTVDYSSIIELFDSEGHQKTLLLDNTCHVGGLSYSENLNTLYITEYAANDKKNSGKNNKPTICYYDIDYVASLGDGEVLKGTSIELPEESSLTHASYLTVNDNYLYVGDFHTNRLEKYELTNNGKSLNYVCSYNTPNSTQGLCVYNYQGEEYIAFSCSEGRTKDSNLIIMSTESNQLSNFKTIKMPCLSEQVSIDKDGNFMVVFENDAAKYQKGLDNDGSKCSTDVIDFVCHLDMDKVMNS